MLRKRITVALTTAALALTGVAFGATGATAEPRVAGSTDGSALEKRHTKRHTLVLEKRHTKRHTFAAKRHTKRHT